MSMNSPRKSKKFTTPTFKLSGGNLTGIASRQIQVVDGAQNARIKERNHDQDRSSNAVYVLHSIVNNLLFSDGISALSVIAAVAACGQVLSAAAHRTAQEQELIIETVTEALRRRLHHPECLKFDMHPRYWCSRPPKALGSFRS
ncbi:hypothetical protein HYQ44_002641 [Verticillium longisporum]|nr:hypothetical protein HYQ44_002641 [Verticillium longisporum]